MCDSSSSSCNYVPLGQTYCGAGVQGCNGKAPAVGIPSMAVSQVLMVPTFGAGPYTAGSAKGWGYDSLTHGGAKTCTGYFDLKAAYPMSCPPIMNRACNGTTFSKPSNTGFSL